ncbi:unnamed protein product, partial [Polarella glacialis]
KPRESLSEGSPCHGRLPLSQGMAAPGRSVTLTVFMEGTGNPMDQVATQIALFSRLCVATALAEELDGSLAKSGAGHYKLSFAGCGVTHGLAGTLFAVGLR